MSTRRERLRTETIGEIKATAWKQIGEDGAASLSLRAIAREMGMTAPGLYRYYKDRDALVVKIVGVRCAASTPKPPRLPFGVILTPRLEGSATLTVCAGQSLDVEPGVRSDRPG